MVWNIIKKSPLFTKIQNTFDYTVNYLSSIKVNETVKSYSYNYGWVILEYISKMEVFVTKKWHKYKKCFFTYSNNQEIIFIGDGVRKYSFHLGISLLKILKANDFNIEYDFILQNVPIKEVDEYDTYTNCYIVYENHKDVVSRSFIKPPKCIEFKTMMLTFKNNHEKMYNIDLKHNQFHIPGNILYDRSFFRWFIKNEYDIDIKNEEYTVSFIDHNMDYITLLDTCYILIEKDDYKIVNIDNKI